MNRIGLFFLVYLFAFYLQAQESIQPIPRNENAIGYFVPTQHHNLGFYSNSFDNQQSAIQVAYQSIDAQQENLVQFVVKRGAKRKIKKARFFIDSVEIERFSHKKDTFLLEIPQKTENYSIFALSGNDTAAILQVDILPVKKKFITLVPLMDVELNKDSIQQQLDSIFRAANLEFEITIQRKFEIDTLYQQWNNPDKNRLRYTPQMIHLRNEFLKKNPLFNQNQLLFFITPDFNSTEIASYMVKSKAMGFISEGHLDELSEMIAKEYLQSYVHLDYIFLERNQSFSQENWLKINEYPDIYSFYDDYEDVKTDNGLIAYYIFEVDENGNLILPDDNWISGIHRPTKKNTFSYHVHINNPVFQPLFYILKKPFNLLHVLVGIGVIIGLSAIFKRIRLYMQNRLKLGRFWRFSTRFIEWGMILVGVWVNFIFVDFANRFFEVSEGEIVEYQGKTIEEVAEDLVLNLHPREIQEDEIASEIMVKKGNQYYLQREKRVLEFNVIIDDNEQVQQIQFIKSSDTLHTSLLEKPKLAESHYMIFHFYCDGNEWLKDEVYNHLGVNLTEKIQLEDPPRRILLFVNGYRPTSLGRTFEESFDDILKNGLEFPNSLNRLYDNDRYNYWHPWRKMDDKFKERINPTEVFYADGHYSVSTSNYRSLLNFTTTSSRYPDRCKDSSHHVCYKTNYFNLGPLGTIKRNTHNMLATRSNTHGFNQRKEGGNVAGRNLYQLLNELPNCSQNDTLYVVAHSMGFAYAQGIIEQLKGKIQFGDFYIIAPENGKAGNVQLSDWKEVWQYGSNLGEKNQDAPCLQDGVAPQSAVKGIGSHRIFLPKENYKQKGFFDSHFIGYYSWVLDLKEGDKGSVKQR